MVIFRENSEDIYAGIEWEANSTGAKKIIDYLQTEMKVDRIRYTDECGIGIKPVSRKGSQRLIRAAIEYATMIAARDPRPQRQYYEIYRRYIS